MLITHHKEKLIEAISFFVKNTKNCGTIKLFKLLYWLDYHHFRETGKSVTGLDYFALPMGPVPTSLYEQIKTGSGDIVSNFYISRHETVKVEFVRRVENENLSVDPPQTIQLATGIKPKVPHKHYYLTRREMRIAENLAEIFKEVKASDISDISHIRGGPWQKALKTTGPNSRIDFLSALVPMTAGDYLEEEELRERVAEYEETLRALT